MRDRINPPDHQLPTIFADAFALAQKGGAVIQFLGKSVVRTLVITWLSLSIASVVLAAVNWLLLHERLKASTEAVAVVNAADGIQKTLLDIETAQRGFALTGDEVFLEPFNKAETTLPSQFNNFAARVRNNPDDLKGVMELHAQTESLVNFTRGVIKARREQGAQAALDLIKTGQGKHMMDDIRSRIDAIKSFRYSLSSEEGRSSRAQLLRASLTSLVAGAVGVGAGLFAFYLTRVSLRHQQRERILLEAKLHAEHENKEKSTFLANMSHEIRTPLNAIQGFSELLSSEMHEPRHRQYLQSIRTSATSLQQLINDVLDMSKIEAGVLELQLEPTNPKELCEFIMTVFGEAAQKKNLKLDCRIADNLPRALMLDRVRLRQILVNLVGNAVKFTDQGGITTIVNCEKNASSQDYVALSIEVQDTGMGIPKDRLEAIFKPFVQAGLHQDREKGGTGLGLSIVQRLAQLMGGTVTATSVPGKGSAFRLNLPSVPVSARLPVSEKVEKDETVDFNEFQPARILVVDDNEQNSRLLGGIFAGSHHELAYASDGRAVADLVRSFRPDIVLMDIRMPHMTGPEALAAVRQIPDKQLLPVIAVTASNIFEEQPQLTEKFSGFIRKPFSRRELFDELASFLPRRSEHELASMDPIPATAFPGKAVIAPPALTAELREMEARVWPGLRDSVAINETRGFAHRLESLAREADCEPLLAYAETLAHYADTYTVDALEKHLQLFPGLIERMEHPVA